MADLNGCHPKAMEAHLLKLGAAVDAKEISVTKSFDDMRARELHAEGLSDLDMSECLGVSKATVASWRNRNNIPVNRKQKENNKMATTIKQKSNDFWIRTDVNLPPKDGYYLCVVSDIEDGVAVNQRISAVTFVGGVFGLHGNGFISHWCQGPELPVAVRKGGVHAK